MGCSSIDIEPRKLNIKYAINGTGKSTIAKAIQAKVTGNEDGLKHYCHSGMKEMPMNINPASPDWKIFTVSKFSTRIM